jgi:hypothetical protein
MSEETTADRTVIQYGHDAQADGHRALVRLKWLWADDSGEGYSASWRGESRTP